MSGMTLSIGANLLKRTLEQHGPIYNGPGSKKEYKLFTLPRLDQHQKDNIEKAKKYAMEQSIKCVLHKQTSQHQSQQLANIKRTQALVLLSRIYVGSINYDIKEDTLKQAFIPFGPIVSVSLTYDPITNKHKGFAFIEFALPEAAQLALEQMNGALLGGRNLKVGRPSNMPTNYVGVDELLNESKNGNRIYVASVHADLTEDDLKTVFEAFGKIVSCNLEPEPTRPGRHRGFGFVEYETAQAAQDAIINMNMFDLGGQLLRVGRSISPSNQPNSSQSQTVLPPAAAVAAASVTAKVIAMEAEQVTKGCGVSDSNVETSESMSDNAKKINNWDLIEANEDKEKLKKESDVSDTELSYNLERQENLQIKGLDARAAVMHKLMSRSSQDTVMVLKNMVGPEDCDESLESEVTEECTKFGLVDRVIIYQEKQSADPSSEVIVKIFVVFSSSESVLKACESLNGRFFGGRVVKAERYDYNLFVANDLSH